MKRGIAGRKGLQAILIVGLTGLLLLNACASAPMVSVEKKVVEFGNITPLTGPAAASEQIGFRSVEDSVRYFNEETGIPGVTIKHSWIDTGFQVPNAISAYRRFIESGVVCLFSDHAEALPAILPQLEEDGVPLLGGIQDEQLLYPPSWYYGVFPTYAETFTAMADYIMEIWQEERPPKLAFMGSDTAFTWNPVEQGTKYAEGIGIEMLPTEIVPHVPLDTTSQLLRLSEQGADFVYIQMIPAVAVPILRDAERLGFLDKMQFCGCEDSVGDALVKGAGTAAEGYLVPQTIPAWDETEVIGIKIMTDNQIRHYGKEVSGKYAAYPKVWKATAIICEAIKRAIGNVGYENLDGRAVKEALDSIKDFDVYGLGKITYTPEDHRGSDRLAVYQLKGGKVVRVSDWRKAPMLVP